MSRDPFSIHTSNSIFFFSYSPIFFTLLTSCFSPFPPPPPTSLLPLNLLLLPGSVFLFFLSNSLLLHKLTIFFPHLPSLLFCLSLPSSPHLIQSSLTVTSPFIPAIIYLPPLFSLFFFLHLPSPSLPTHPLFLLRHPGSIFFFPLRNSFSSSPLPPSHSSLSFLTLALSSLSAPLPNDAPCTSFLPSCAPCLTCAVTCRT